jgi:HEAT repeat protein
MSIGPIKNWSGRRGKAGAVLAVLLAARVLTASEVTVANRAAPAQDSASAVPEKAQTASAAHAMPQVENGKVAQREVKASLTQEVDEWTKATDKTQWLGYAVPAVSSERRSCCGNDGGDGNRESCGPCRLESAGSGNNYNLRRGDVKLEGPANLLVLLRAEHRKIARVRAVSDDCTLDAAGLQVTWLTGAKPAESVRLLERLVNSKELDERGGDRLSRGALMAIAMHADTSADQVLATYTAPDKPEGLRKEAAFWAGEARGAAGLQLLKRMAKEDPSIEVRAQVAFALSISHESNAIDEMIRMAHEDASGHVRGQALFWLAQKAGKKASSAISGAIDNDPDTDVKKKAVFALSQMPKDDGVPKLIQVAETNRNPEVRKQAMFWLGQSNDPRALEFFEKVLGK